MEIFNEMYGMYYRVVLEILSQKRGLTKQDCAEIVRELGFDESGLHLLPQLTENWHLLVERSDEAVYDSILKRDWLPVQGSLLKRWLKTVLRDPRMGLFLTDDVLAGLERELVDYDVLFDVDTIWCFDGFLGGDMYLEPGYRARFGVVLDALYEKRELELVYQAQEGRVLTGTFLPVRLEFSQKNDKFRLLCFRKADLMPFTLNMAKLAEVRMGAQIEGELPEHKAEMVIVKCHVVDHRNAVDRAMIHFADYKKKAFRTARANVFEIEIYCPRGDLTELVIQLLSFGPMVQVLEPVSVVAEMKRRLARQLEF
ncbi:WYL domain-containing protein [Listeria grandensis]|uniref:WYL domain-containing protein n=1 Tax=Listeria grandensis TaxID=1494963 RepID=A0A7X0Y400_9LIST|nr:WYL domain-containing protein [Listeria grandensis]MBC1936448.1 WYL domain-containing protein [Listeria grandensis]